MFVTPLAAIPLGVAACVYLEEYARKNWLTEVIEMSIANLGGVPSIVYGLIAVGLFVYQFQFGQSTLSVGLTLAFLILPIVILATGEALRSIPAHTIRALKSVSLDFPEKKVTALIGPPAAARKRCYAASTGCTTLGRGRFSCLRYCIVRQSCAGGVKHHRPNGRRKQYTLLYHHGHRLGHSAATSHFRAQSRLPLGSRRELHQRGLRLDAPTGYTPATNQFSVRVTDDGSPPLSTTNTFKVVVLKVPHFNPPSPPTNGIVTLAWASYPGKTYRLCYKDQLGPGGWTNFPNDFLATGTFTSATNNLGMARQRFYQLQILD